MVDKMMAITTRRHRVIIPDKSGQAVGQTCRRCGADYWLRMGGKNGGITRRCGICYRRGAKDLYGRDLEKHRLMKREASWRQRGIAITQIEYEQMFREQNGVCAICHKAKSYKLWVDHNHETGKVRGLLCARCNALALNIDTVRAVLFYLEQYDNA